MVANNPFQVNLGGDWAKTPKDWQKDEKQNKAPKASSEQNLKGLSIQISIDEDSSQEQKEEKQPSKTENENQKSPEKDKKVGEEVILEKLKEWLDIKVPLEEEVDQLLILKEVKKKQRIARMKKMLIKFFTIAIIGAIGFAGWRGFNNKEYVASLLGLEKVIITKTVEKKVSLPQKLDMSFFEGQTLARTYYDLLYKLIAEAPVEKINDESKRDYLQQLNLITKNRARQKLDLWHYKRQLLPLELKIFGKQK